MSATSPTDDAVVIRFPPATAPGVLSRALKDARRIGGRGLATASVWCDDLQDGEDVESVHKRLVLAAFDGGMDPSTNSKYYVCTQLLKLRERGFDISKDGYDGEPREHYSVVLGDNPTEDDASRFLEAFTSTERAASESRDHD